MSEKKPLGEIDDGKSVIKPGAKYDPKAELLAKGATTPKGSAGLASDNFGDPGDGDGNDPLTSIASSMYERRDDGNVYYSWGEQVDPSAVASAEAHLQAIGYEIYDPEPLDRLSLLERALIGMDAHKVLEDFTHQQLNSADWFANKTGDDEGIRFVGRPDLGSRYSREIWELKPDNIGAILRGEKQVVGYVQSQHDERDIPGVLTHRLADPYHVANESPQAAGLVGFVEGDAYPGRYGSYSYRYAGQGVEAYRWSGSNFASYSLGITRIPNWVVGPLPGGRNDTSPAY